MHRRIRKRFPVQSLGNFLERLGPAFAVTMFVLVIGLGVTLVLGSMWALLRKSAAGSRPERMAPPLHEQPAT